MQGSKPTVFVSSTYFDLAQVRADLGDFIEKQLGYRVLISEDPSFPIDPYVDTVENCRRQVDESADVLVLIIGGRYGSVDAATSKSITNIEYLAARQKGIPVYAFIEKRTLTLLEVSDKEGAELSSMVDSGQLFAFIRQVRSGDRVWTIGFDRAQDIVAALRAQFAHLMLDGLALRRELSAKPGDLRSLSLSGKAVRLALEQPVAWEGRMFAQVLTDEIAVASADRDAHRRRIVFGTGDDVEDVTAVLRWIGVRMHELQRLVDGVTTLMNESLQEAFGKPGEPGDPRAIAMVARQVADAFRHAIAWSQDVRRAHLPSLWHGVQRELAAFADDIVTQLEVMGPNVTKAVDAALAGRPADGVTTIAYTLTITLPNQARFRQELAKAGDAVGVSVGEMDDSIASDGSDG